MDWSIENSYFDQGIELICGADEAGRGPLAGPVFAAAVILPKGVVIEGLNDSKKLTAKRRDELYDEIKKVALDWAVAHAEVYEIEAINILNASMLAMNRAIKQLKHTPELALIDGNAVEINEIIVLRRVFKPIEIAEDVEMGRDAVFRILEG